MRYQNNDYATYVELREMARSVQQYALNHTISRTERADAMLELIRMGWSAGFPCNYLAQF